MTQLTVITPPAEAPVSLETVKAFLRVGHDGDDGLIDELVQAARERLETVAGLALVAQSIRVTWETLPAGLVKGGARLPRRPARQIEAARTVDASDTATDVTDRFQLAGDRLCLRPWQPCPAVPEGGRLELDLSVGYGAATDIPEDLLEALFRLVAATYASRVPDLMTKAHPGGLPPDVQAILDARKEVRL